MAQVADGRGRFDCASLDFKKAFDSVHHQTLVDSTRPIMELSSLGWLDSYPDGRSIRVKVDSVLSSPHIISQAGVAQGSHLAPVL